MESFETTIRSLENAYFIVRILCEIKSEGGGAKGAEGAGGNSAYDRRATTSNNVRKWKHVLFCYQVNGNRIEECVRL